MSLVRSQTTDYGNYFPDLTSQLHWNGMVLFCKQPHLFPVPLPDTP
jgi:hypothetical protein